MSSNIDEAVRLIRDTPRIVVITGAGISVASGLPMFRSNSPEAIWSQDDMEIATWAFYRRDPSRWWQWFFERFIGINEAEPNPAHQALAEIERWKTSRGDSLLVITQNIDTLHERGGTENLVKVHGTAAAVRCSRTGCRRGAPSGSIPLGELDFSQFGSGNTSRIPLCPECGAIIRPHVLLFDEYYIEHDDYGFVRSQQAIENALLFVFVGTSFSVGLTELALDFAYRNEIPMISIDPAGRLPRAVNVGLNAEVALPEIVRRLKEER